VARKATDATDGFARQVFEALPQTKELLKSVKGLHLGQTLEIAPDRFPDWLKPYTILLAAMHRRDEKGWEDAPYILSGVLAQIHERYEQKTLAVAGTPGAGFSGLLGNAVDYDIMTALNGTKVPITIYRYEKNDDPEPLALETPLPSDHVFVQVPATV